MLLITLLVSTTGCFRLGSDAQALQQSLAKSIGADCDRVVELSVGSLTLGLVRAGSTFFELDDEARTALGVFRGAEVGVYQLKMSEPWNVASALEAADRAMERRGWDRVVGVLQQKELVGVYVTRNTSRSDLLEVCVCVVQPREMVVASVRADANSVVELAGQVARSEGVFADRMRQRPPQTTITKTPARSVALAL